MVCGNFTLDLRKVHWGYINCANLWKITMETLAMVAQVFKERSITYIFVWMACSVQTSWTSAGSDEPTVMSIAWHCYQNSTLFHENWCQIVHDLADKEGLAKGHVNIFWLLKRTCIISSPNLYWRFWQLIRNRSMLTSERNSNEEGLRRVDKRRITLYTVIKIKAYWLDHIMRQNGLLLDTIVWSW